MTTLTVRRTPDEIVARIRAVADSDYDFFGAEQASLYRALDFEHAKEFLLEGATPEGWAKCRTKPIAEEAIEYVAFAVSKIRNHRGLSTARSVSHFRAWAWLLLDDDAFQQFDATPYENYGAPQVRKFCELIGRPDLWPTSDHGLQRMADGRPCFDECGQGCGL